MAIITVKELAQTYKMSPDEVRRTLRSNGFSVGKGKRYKWEESAPELVQVREAIASSPYSWRLSSGEYPVSFEEMVRNLFTWIFECRGEGGPGTFAIRCFLKRLSLGLLLLPNIALFFALRSLWQIVKDNALTRRGLIIFSLAVVTILPTAWVMDGVLYPFAVYLFIEFIVWIFKFVFGTSDWENLPGHTPQAKFGKLRRGIKRGRRVF